LEKPLEFPAYESPQVLHSPPIDTKVAIASAGSGTEVDSLRVVVEEKFDIVDESEQQGRELIMKVGLVLLDKFGPRE